MSFRLTSKKERKRFIKYFSIGFSTFLFDLFLIFLIVELFGVDDVLAAGIAFLIAVTVNYFFLRRYAFSETREGVAKTYTFFIVMATVGFFSITGLMYLFVKVLEINYLFSRAFIASMVGAVGYLINIFFNFKVHK
jgi:putative flippase GtrA